MLWYKSWLDTQRWFLLGVIALCAQVIALYMSYPLDAATSFPNGALGVMPAELDLVRHGDFRSYVWIRWFSTTLLLMWPVFAIGLVGTGFEQAAGREYLLSLPVTRRRIVWTRARLLLVQLLVLTIVPTLLLCALAPTVGQRFPLSDALVHSIVLVASSAGLVGLTMYLRTVVSDAGAYAALAAIVIVWAVVTFVAKDLTVYSVFRAMNGADYFFYRRLPWMPMALSVGTALAFGYLALRTIEARDF
jgi:hypothetical protein